MVLLIGLSSDHLSCLICQCFILIGIYWCAVSQVEAFGCRIGSMWKSSRIVQGAWFVVVGGVAFVVMPHMITSWSCRMHMLHCHQRGFKRSLLRLLYSLPGKVLHKHQFNNPLHLYYLQMNEVIYCFCRIRAQFELNIAKNIAIGALQRQHTITRTFNHSSSTLQQTFDLIFKLTFLNMNRLHLYKIWAIPSLVFDI